MNKQYVRCKVCGFVMEAGKEEKGCPACGVPKTAFEPFRMTISEKRKKLLEQHIHPIILHFPQGAVMFGFMLLFLSFFVSGEVKNLILSTVTILVVTLPLTVILGFVTGLIDGKIRFKKVTTPILKIKIYVGIVFFVLSVIAMFVELYMGESGRILLTIILLLCNLSAAVLGKLGSSLLDSKMPG